MNSISARSGCFLVVAFLAALAACDGGPIAQPEPDAGPLIGCTNDVDCGGAGLLCVAGECRLGQCNPNVEASCGIDTAPEDRDPACCKFFENCNVLSLSCERDPAAVGIGCPPEDPSCVPCSENTDCVAELGFQSFCSGGRCFSQTGRTDCTQDFQCESDERCDTTEFLCVPDSGACRFCSADFPELCCANDFVCDTASGSCIDARFERECDVADDCPVGGDQCDTFGRCVQCVEQGDCGPGTECNAATGLCDSTIGRCTDDRECPASQRCINEQCTTPQCTRDSNCSDARQRCESFVCVLPPAVCPTDVNEPNNSLETAHPLTGIAAGYPGVLCRGDVDFVSFPILPSMRYVVTVAVAGGSTTGLRATLLDSQRREESAATFSGANVQLVGVSGPEESGRFTVSLGNGSNTQRDQWNYTVTITETPALPEADCSAAGVAGQEPNDTFATAITLVPGTPRLLSRCGTNDADFFKIDVPELNGVSVTLDGFDNAEGNLQVQLFKSAAATGSLVATSTGTSNSEVASAPEGSTTYFAKVSLVSGFGVLSNQIYRLTATAVPRPAACADDVGENDGVPASARPLELTTTAGVLGGTTSAKRCNVQDIDLVRFTVPANRGGSVRVDFTHNEGDIRLDLLKEDGTSLSPALSSNSSSTANPFEAIDLPILATDQTYLAKIAMAVSTGNPTIGQNWTLKVSTYDAAICIEERDDGLLANATCVGNFEIAATGASSRPCLGNRLLEPLETTLASCASGSGPGCGVSCGIADTDSYRIGPLVRDQSVKVTLTYDPALGGQTLQIGRSSSATATTLTGPQTIRDAVVPTGIITATVLISTASAAGDYFALVKPVGAAGHEAQPYALSVEVGAACSKDTFEGTSGNATAGAASLIRPDPVALQDTIVIGATVCSDDVDVYEFIGLRNEQITVTLDDVTGARLRIGVRPAVLTTLPTTISGSTAGITTPVPANGTSLVTASTPASVSFTMTTTKQMYAVVDRSGTTAGVGTYELRIDVGGAEPDANP